ATVSDEGVVTSVAPGTTTIIASIGDGKGPGNKKETGEIQGGCDVTVTLRPIAHIEIRPITALARAGETQHFDVMAYGPDGSHIPDVAAVYRSSDPSVATVDGAGVATGRKPGAAKIRVELAGQYAEATLLVN
ncbi:MAG TPA: Ig-like domain-containing protein, partial [Thermoanaerobaculia bacterium]